MKICFLSSMHPPDDKRVFEKEAVYLAMNGFDVTHLAPGNGEELMRNNVSIKTYEAKRGIMGRLSQLVNLYKQAKDINADVYHCNEVDSWMIGVALRIFRKKICVFDVHEHYAEDFAEIRFPAWLRPPVKLFIRLLIWLLSKFTDRVVLAKSSLWQDYKDMGKEQVILVQNFTPLTAVKFSEHKTATNDYTSGNLKAIHLGLFNKARGLIPMLEAIHESENVELTLLGEYSDGDEKDLHNLFKQYGVSDRVIYKPWLPFEEAMNEVRKSDVGLIMFQPGFYNHTYALPHKLFDYMAAGLPVIAPEFAVEVNEIVKTSECGILIDTADWKPLRNALQKLGSNPEIRQEMAKNGMSAIKERYNWELESKTLVNMYKQLATRKI